MRRWASRRASGKSEIQRKRPEKNPTRTAGPSWSIKTRPVVPRRCRERKADPGAGEDRPEEVQDHAEAIATALMKRARQILYRPAGSCSRAHRRIDVQPRAIPETGRRAARIRLRLRGARSDVAHVGADEVGGGSGGPREAPPPVHRPSPAVALPPDRPRPVRRLHRRA